VAGGPPTGLYHYRVLATDEAGSTQDAGPSTADDYEDDDLPAGDGGSPPQVMFAWGSFDVKDEEESTLISPTESDASGEMTSLGTDPGLDPGLAEFEGGVEAEDDWETPVV
jgi:hypothetical protein